MSMKTCPTLPNELWIKVLEQLQDEEGMPDAWMTARHVCIPWRQAIELNFRNKHLQETSILYDLGIYYTSREETDEDSDLPIAKNLDATFEFSRLAENENTAIFAAIEVEEPPRHRIAVRLQDRVLDERIEEPQHHVKIYGDVNDTPMPGFSIDYFKMELSCDWRGLFTRFYGEEKLYNKYVKEASDALAEQSGAVSRQVARGEMDVLQVMDKTLKAFKVIWNDSRKKARRARMKRQFLESGKNFVLGRVEDSEDKALKTMDTMRYFFSLPEDSDSEGDEDEEDSDDVGDGWETDENDEHEEGEETEDNLVTPTSTLPIHLLPVRRNASLADDQLIPNP